MASFFQAGFGSKLGAKIAFVITLLLVIFLARGVYGVYEKSRYASDNYLEAKQRLVELELRKQQISDHLAKFSTSRGLEDEIRNNFSVVRPGEKMLLVIDNASTTATTSQPVHQGLWQTLKAALFGN